MIQFLKMDSDIRRNGMKDRDTFNGRRIQREHFPATYYFVFSLRT